MRIRSLHKPEPARDRPAQHPDACPDWFRSFDWSWYATYTFDREVSSSQADDLIEQYFLGCEKYLKIAIPALITKQGGRYSGLGKSPSSVHFHSLLITPVDVSATFLKDSWERWPFGGTRCRRKCHSRCT